jgi:acyl-CoA thioesterase
MVPFEAEIFILILSMKPEEVVEAMMENDFFSQWLGIRIISKEQGSCTLSLSIRKEMLNGFGIAHGGITYSLADSALAFASNSKGRKSVSIETSISHIISLKEKDEIIAEARCETETEKLGHYAVKVYLKNEPEKTVALFKGIVYKTSKSW